MAKPISKLPGDVKKVALLIVANTEKRQRNVALEIYTGLTRVNPKKTGRSAGSWQIGIGTPVRLVSEPPKGSEENPYAFVNRRATEESSKLATPLSAKVSTIYITNIVEYIGPLNAGSSPQADPMWIEREVKRASVGAAGVKLLEGKV